MNKIYKRADLLGISVYEFINNYCLILDCEGFFYGAVLKEDIDKYYISHDDCSDSMIIIDLQYGIDNLKVLEYDFLEKILEEKYV